MLAFDPWIRERQIYERCLNSLLKATVTDLFASLLQTTVTDWFASLFKGPR